MLYYLTLPYISTSHFANLMHYISFRSAVAMFLSIFISIFLGPYIISYLKRQQLHGQPIRSDGPQTHKEKAGTPTMGGVMIVGSTIRATSFL